MKKTIVGVVLLFVLALSASGQGTTGEILGTVSDASGASVAGAKVTVRNTDTNVTRSVDANSEGRFVVAQLPPGNYQVTIEKTGFAKYVYGPLTLRLGQDAELPVKMEVASMTETVNVTGESPLLNTTNSEVGVNIESKRISELPMAPNRNILNLALQVPGISQLSSGNSSFASGGVSFSVNGMRTRSNNFMVDGQDSVNPSVGGLVQEINNPDAVAEFRLITNQFLPEYGRTAGSVVNIVTKSGTNGFHGSAYWTYNGNALNARSNLDKLSGFTKAPWRVEDQFAGTVGGPVIRDKAFFFVSGLRWTDHRFASGAAITGAPTAEGRSILNAAVGTRPQVKALLDNLPAAQTATGNTVRFVANGQTYVVPVGTLSEAASNTLDVWQWTFRGDINVSSKNSLQLRAMWDDRTQVSGQSTPAGLTSLSPTQRVAAGATLTTTIDSTKFNELRLNFQRFNQVTSAANDNALTIPSMEVNELGLVGFNAANSRTAIGLALNLPQSQALTNYQLADNFGWNVNGHSLKFGIDFRRQDQNQDFNPSVRGRLTYANLQGLVDDIAQTASINTFLPGVGRWQYYRYYDYGFYVQDEWRVKPNFTLTYGIRYETPGNPADWLQQVNAGVVAANNNNPGYVFAPVPPRDMNNWAPRFGFNYRPTGGKFLADGKTVFRGGYSRTYDLIFNNIYLNIYSAWPFTQVNQLTANSPNSWNYVYGLGFQGVPAPPPPDPMQVTRTIVANDFRAPYAEQFAFQIQRELTSNWVFTAGYIATKGTALFQTIDGNPTVPGTQATRRLYPEQGVRRLRANAASSTYHSLQASMERRMSKNFSMAGHYTYSTFIDNTSEIFNPSVAGEVAVAQDSYNRNLDRGRSTYDRPQRFSVNGVYMLPWFQDQRGFAGHVLGGWQISGFLTFQSGAPFSPLNGSDPGFALSGIDALVGNSIRPNLATTAPLSNLGLNYILANGGRALFSPVTAARPIGDAGRNILRADGINNLDLSILKNIRITEGNQLQFRAEMYNLTNTRDYGIPEARINNAGFARQGNTDGGNRRIVLGLRYTF